jgi:OmpA-OmpF porin, OOP family
MRQISALLTTIFIVFFIFSGCSHTPPPASEPAAKPSPPTGPSSPGVVKFEVKGAECKVTDATDSDADGVPDNLDKCPCTPFGVKVDENGCPLDADGDGVPDYLDKCPCTPKGVKVDEKGCPIDSDDDGVLDTDDKCPNTPKGAQVSESGCWEIGEALFDLNKSDIKPQYYSLLDQAVSVLNRHPSLKIIIEGHTCSLGSAAYNQKLSEARAESVKRYFVRKGISGSRLRTVGYGETRPKTSNDTEVGRMLNRRVQFVPIWPK